MTMAHRSSEQSGENDLARIESLVGKIIQQGGFNLTFAIRKGEGSGAVVDFEGADADLLLERNAALLDALEYVVLKAVHTNEDTSGRIIFDCKDWRRVRAEELKLTALMAARQVLESGTPFSLNPMTSRERRIVHVALKEEAGVRTVSEGAGEHRRVVIHPAEPPSTS